MKRAEVRFNARFDCFKTVPVECWQHPSLSTTRSVWQNRNDVAFDILLSAAVN